MKSSIKIDFTDIGKGLGLQPVIKIQLITTDDPRDKLLQTFFQTLGGESSWLSVVFEGYTLGHQYISVYPVSSEELEETIVIINNRIIENDKNSYYLNNTTALPERQENQQQST